MRSTIIDKFISGKILKKINCILKFLWKIILNYYFCIVDGSKVGELFSFVPNTCRPAVTSGSSEGW